MASINKVILVGNLGTDPELDMFSNLDQLKYFDQPDYLFYLTYEGLGSIRWKQTSNPVTSTTVEGYQLVLNNLK